MKSMLLLLAATALLLATASASCTFPPALIGRWRNPTNNHTLGFTQDTLTGFQIDTKDIPFHCYLSDQGKYAFASENVDLFNFEVKIYFCWRLMQVTTNKFVYYELTERTRKDSEDRGLAYLISEVPYPSLNLVCDTEGQAPTFLTREHFTPF